MSRFGLWFTRTLAVLTVAGSATAVAATLAATPASASPTADASFVIDPVGPTTGHVDFASSHVDTSSTFDIRLAKVTPHPVAGSTFASGVNLVGPNCRTAKPITVAMGGTIDFVHGGTFSGTYTIPKFQHCEAMTAAINTIIPGGGNTFAATFSPPGASLPLTLGSGPVGVTGQAPVTPPKPGGGLLGLILGTS